MSRGAKKMSEEDRALWNKVLQSVKPLRSPKPDLVNKGAARDSMPAPPPVPDQAGKKKATERPHKPAVPAYRPPVSAPKADTGPGLAPLEPRHKRRLSRGQAEVEARLDLHGMRQSTAFHTLIGFLRQAQANRVGTVLVITGKGVPASRGGEPSQERGVLRRLVPQWLARPEFRDLVIGFETAARRHGGEGALYVRIRRRK